MKECDNSTRKIHISSNFALSISLLIMFDTLLLRPSLHCNTPLYFTTLHPTTLCYTSPNFTPKHFTTLIDTSLPLIYTSLPSHLVSRIYISYRSTSPHITTLDTVQFYFTSHHYTGHSTVLVSKLIILCVVRINFEKNIVDTALKSLWSCAFLLGVRCVRLLCIVRKSLIRSIRFVKFCRVLTKVSYT
jgi:hypothetical protein